MRRIIQLISDPNDSDIIAFCDDGTLWRGFWDMAIFVWKPLPDVPQGPPQKVERGAIRKPVTTYVGGGGGCAGGTVGYGSGGVGGTGSDGRCKSHLDIRDFGAKCDGVTDDTAAIQAATEFVHIGGLVSPLNFNSEGLTEEDIAADIAAIQRYYSLTKVRE